MPGVHVLLILSGTLHFICFRQSQGIIGPVVSECMLKVLCMHTTVHIALSCDYQYDIQPAQTALSCSELTAFVLRCQVSSDRSDFSISWHYSTSEPNSSNVLTAMSIIDNSLSDFIIKEWNYSLSTRSNLTSELRRGDISEKDNIDGYYWCSVNSTSNDMNDTNITTVTPNPSIILHILHHIYCTKVERHKCEEEVNFYSAMSFESTSRCADHNYTSVDIVEAQNCTTGDRIEPTTYTEQISDSETDVFGPENMDDSDIQNATSTPTPTVTVKPPTLPLSLGIITGGFMGGLILVLFTVIGLLLICMMKMKTNKNQNRRPCPQVDSITPFDDIQMYSPAPATSKNEMDESSRVSIMFLESNISYDCPLALVTTSQTNENIYACVH